MSAHPAHPLVRRLALSLLALVAALGWVAGPAAPVAHADNYVPAVDPTCGVRVEVTDGRLQAVVGAGTPGNVPTTGTMTVRFTHDGDTLDTVVVRYDGGRQTVDGPRITAPSGTYGAAVRFESRGPGAGSSCSASDSQSYAVLGAGGGQGGQDGQDGQGGGSVDVGSGSAEGDAGGDGGLLPDTGGPALWALALGVGLVAVGVPLLRRRRHSS